MFSFDELIPISEILLSQLMLVYDGMILGELSIGIMFT